MLTKQLNNYEAENEQAHGPLADKVAKLKKIYTIPVDLELELDAIRIKGDIIAYEKKARVPDNDTLSQERVDKLNDELESCKLTLIDTFKMVQPTQNSLSLLCDRTEATKFFVSVMNDKYSHYTKDKTINTMLKKLEYAIKTATKRIEEMKEDMMNDDIEAKIPGSSRKRNFQDIPPQSRIMQKIVPDFKNLDSHPPGTKATVAQPKANGAKTTSQKNNATENDYSFLFVDARFG